MRHNKIVTVRFHYTIISFPLRRFFANVQRLYISILVYTQQRRFMTGLLIDPSNRPYRDPSYHSFVTWCYLGQNVPSSRMCCAPDLPGVS